MQPLILATLTGAFLLAASVACALAGSVYVGGALLAGLPVAGALATFRGALPPIRVALALTAPTALLSLVLSTVEPSWSTALVWSAVAIGIFLIVLLCAEFGRWRKGKVLPRDSART